MTPLLAILAMQTKLATPEAYLPGQREIVLGPTSCRDTVMSLVYTRETGTLVEGSSVVAPTYAQYAEGYVRWSTQPGKLDGKSIVLIKEEGVRKVSFRNALTLFQAIRNYWVTPEGKILRQQDLLSDPTGIRQAICEFSDDHVDVTKIEAGKETKFTLYPEGDLAKIQAQFRPMMENGQVILKDKEFVVYDPFGGIRLFKVRHVGPFGGSTLDQKVKGQTFEIAGPTFKQRVFVNDKGDMVRAEFPQNRALVLMTAPEGMENSYWTTSPRTTRIKN